MQSGIISKVAITPANITDAQGLKHICPSQGLFTQIKATVLLLQGKLQLAKDAT
ncbi:MAG: hypothetical protein JNJ47_03080 [Alphaproteobacteria bacterium]|nr:hypothetical protein [Alphaproteobacteria bacterium]